MSKYSISPNAACQFNYLRISYQRFYSTQNLKICLNEEYADSHNSLKKKTLSYKSFSRFVNLSNENKNTKKKQVFEENLLKRVQEAPKIFLRFKDDIIYVSNFLNFRHNISKRFDYIQKVRYSKSSRIANDFSKHFFKQKVSKSNDKNISIKKNFNLKKSNITKPKLNIRIFSKKKIIHLPQAITVSNLSQLLGLKLTKLLGKMKDLGFKNLSYNFLLTYEEASLIAMEYNYDPIVTNKDSFDLHRQENKERISPSLRVPVVTIMGHVDHGKTTLLDFLQKSSIALHEAGGITQHIRAFSVTLSNGEKICFLDTPGHSAFESMRKRGALITDIVVLVVAADDGVMPQTIEAIEHAKKACVPIIVAINKIDKEGVNIQNVKLDLLKNGVELEEFGGDTQVVLISAITVKGQGIKDLEHAIVTLAEISDIRSEVKGSVEGWIIESSVKKTKGHFAIILIKEGTLKLGSYIVSGTTWCRVRSMTDTSNQQVNFAIPGTIVEVTGWKSTPFVGDDVLEAKNEEHAKKVVKNRLIRLNEEKQINDIEVINKKRMENHQKELKMTENVLIEKKLKEIPFIIKADVNGSAEAIKDALLLIRNDEIKTKVIYEDVGTVVESDITRAAAVQGYIVSFNLKLNKKIAQFAHREKVKIISHSIIYKLLDYIKEELSELLPLKVKYNVLGEAKIIKIFIMGKKASKISIAGCSVISGVINKNERIRVLRNQKIIWDGKLESLRHIKKEIIEIKEGEECGMNFGKWDKFLEGDLVEAYREEYIKQKL
ncbi:translation initiation factor IF-2 [Pneumocystis jirovecii RU7]|uniref:Translation initiation factor IF-2, mitochondrial n=1 Tax=Pneumocystis jirovecii (strain RU7) TaxID=1408657 RepID=A0A0W4ZSB9_PNEJ7|nr:translation initiation factor IF-2 [Pneumocystis jirovecii RU7]KTW31247.1 translation initiation factor IF-2 [Pneumocystis jirovecii RU7]